MATTRPFIFENDFDENAIVVESPVIPEIPTFSEDELAAAKEIAYMQGLEEGKRMQQSEIDAQLLQTLTGFEGELVKFIDAESEKRREVQKDAAELAKTIALKICLTESEKHSVDRVVVCLDSVTKMLLDKPKINISVHPDLMEPLTKRIKRMIEGDAVQVITDESLSILDCRFNWQEGGAEVMLQNTLQQIDTYIDQITE